MFLPITKTVQSSKKVKKQKTFRKLNPAFIAGSADFYVAAGNDSSILAFIGIEIQNTVDARTKLPTLRA